jgi:hypothetical protein
VIVSNGRIWVYLTYLFTKLVEVVDIVHLEKPGGIRLDARYSYVVIKVLFNRTVGTSRTIRVINLVLVFGKHRNYGVGRFVILDDGKVFSHHAQVGVTMLDTRRNYVRVRPG